MLLYCCFLSYYLSFCIYFRSFSTCSGSALPWWWIEPAPSSDLDALSFVIVDILVRRGFFTRVYFSFLMVLMLALLS